METIENHKNIFEKEEPLEATDKTVENVNAETSCIPVFEASFIETDNKILKYKCPMCNKKFKSKERVGNHVNSHVIIHSIYTNGDFKCSECNSYFENENTFQLHVKTHQKFRGRPRKGSVSSDDDSVKPFICDKCAKCFKRKQQLVNHNVIHMNIKPFECFQCDKSFKLKQQLQNHMKIHEDIRPFACETCEKSFKFKQQLENHHKSHTDIRPFSCCLCEKAFKFKQQLQMHNRVHDGLRLFKCDTCDKAFKLKQQLQFHMKVHSDERPFQCVACEKSFKLKQQLKTHYKVHSKHFIEGNILEPSINLEMEESGSLHSDNSAEDLKDSNHNTELNSESRNNTDFTTTYLNQRSIEQNDNTRVKSYSELPNDKLTEVKDVADEQPENLKVNEEINEATNEEVNMVPLKEKCTTLNISSEENCTLTPNSESDTSNTTESKMLNKTEECDPSVSTEDLIHKSNFNLTPNSESEASKITETKSANEEDYNFLKLSEDLIETWLGGTDRRLNSSLHPT